ncbi:unnamed protein product, partial [Symbiodinium sp. CCMP2592]
LQTLVFGFVKTGDVLYQPAGYLAVEKVLTDNSISLRMNSLAFTEDTMRSFLAGLSQLSSNEAADLLAEMLPILGPEAVQEFQLPGLEASESEAEDEDGAAEDDRAMHGEHKELPAVKAEIPDSFTEALEASFDASLAAADELAKNGQPPSTLASAADG